MSEKLSEKIISATSYLTVGWVGIIALIIYAIKKRPLSNFLKFNILQSVFLSLLFFALHLAINIIVTVLSYIPIIKYIVAQISFWLNMSVLFGYSIIQLFIVGVTFYCIILSLMGKKPVIYWVSDIIDRR